MIVDDDSENILVTCCLLVRMKKPTSEPIRAKSFAFSSSNEKLIEEAGCQITRDYLIETG